MRKIFYLLRAFVIQMKGVTLGAAGDLFFSRGWQHRRHRDAALENAGARRWGLLQSRFPSLVRMTAETIRNSFAVEIAGLGRTFHVGMAYDAVGAEMARGMPELRLHELKAIGRD